MGRKLKISCGSKIRGFLEVIGSRSGAEDEECSAFISIYLVEDHHDVVYESLDVRPGKRWEIVFEVLEDGVYDITIFSSNNDCYYRVQLYLEKGEADARTTERLIKDRRTAKTLKTRSFSSLRTPFWLSPQPTASLLDPG